MNHSITRLALPLLLAGLLSLGTAPLAAQHGGEDVAATPPAEGERGTVGTILVAHGSNADWNRPVLEIAEQAPTGGPTEVALLMGDHVAEHRFQDAAARLVEQGADRIVVVPLLASSHSSHYDQVRYLTGDLEDLGETMMHHLHMAGIHRAEVEVPIRLTSALDASMEIADILAERALAQTDDPSGQALYIVGHGPNAAEHNARWMENLRLVADSVATLTGFRDVKLGMVRDDAPDPVRAEAVRSIRETIELQHALTRRDVVVVPILISKGYVTGKLRKDLAGLPVVFDGEGLLPHPALASWIARRVQEADRQLQASR
jgi:sirohydrochlorin ferrochelatase